MSQQKPSEAEMEILQVLWEIEPATVKAVHAQISKKRKVGYTTTLKQMQRMLEKKMVSRADGEGKSHIYSSSFQATDIRESMFEKLVATAFGNSVGDLVLHALGNGNTSQEELDEIRKLLDKMDQHKS